MIEGGQETGESLPEGGKDKVLHPQMGKKEPPEQPGGGFRASFGEGGPRKRPFERRPPKRLGRDEKWGGMAGTLGVRGGTGPEGKGSKRITSQAEISFRWWGGGDRNALGTENTITSSKADRKGTLVKKPV